MKQNVLLGSLFIIIIFTLPLFWLKLVQWAFLDDKTLIAEAVSLSGAIIGGIISGGLTLVGVIMTIKSSYKGIEETIYHQVKERTKETIGIKLNKFYQVKNVIYTLDRMLSNRNHGWNDNLEKDDPKVINDAIAKYIIPKYNNLLEISASVDWEFYEEIKKFVEKARKLVFSFEDSDLDILTEIVESLAETIEIVHEKRLSDRFKEASI